MFNVIVEYIGINCGFNGTSHGDVVQQGPSQLLKRLGNSTVAIGHPHQ
jgi:hypothetical protein